MVKKLPKNFLKDTIESLKNTAAAARNSYQAGKTPPVAAKEALLEPVFDDFNTIAVVLSVLVAAILFAAVVTLILEHLNKIKAEGKFLKRLEAFESLLGGVRLNFMLEVFDIPVPNYRKPQETLAEEKPSTEKQQIPAGSKEVTKKVEEKKVEAPGTTSGHPKPGISAFDGKARSLPVAGPTSVYPTLRVAETRTQKSTTEPSSSSKSPTSTSSPTKKSTTSVIAATSSTIAKAIIPEFPIQHRSLHPIRDDPFYPQLATTPIPIAKCLDTVDAVWEAAVTTAAWGVGVVAVRPLKATSKIVGAPVGAVYGMGEFAWRKGLRLAGLSKFKGKGKVVATTNAKKGFFGK
ncbi:hypothetical protein HDU97_003133 [Phlyctochytrium planicorne]|nr:hypothetical protein HDU97_003084 [Phlyctochytrium planicorne]KAJ3109703.1 hypothetical protein HDU97_003133 [Phlyctochytrium planicorne]